MEGIIYQALTSERGPLCQSHTGTWHQASSCQPHRPWVGWCTISQSKLLSPFVLLWHPCRNATCPAALHPQSS